MRSDNRPLPAVGDVLRYAYLWSHEHDRGREEGAKDRPCAVVMLIRRDDGTDEVAVLPITSEQDELHALRAVEADDPVQIVDQRLGVIVARPEKEIRDLFAALRGVGRQDGEIQLR